MSLKSINPCRYCQSDCAKKGLQRNGKQKYKCRSCHRYQQETYSQNAYQLNINERIIGLVKEGCGIRSISRLLEISTGTVIARIKSVAKNIKRPSKLHKGKEFEMDEMKTYVINKENRFWIAYALRRDTKEVVDFKVGRRNKKTLARVIDTLLLSEAKKIYTDKFKLYEYLIPPAIHVKSKYKINHIERKNLDVRTHLKRLFRKTICFSRSVNMLESCLKIYFWYDSVLQPSMLIEE